MVARFLVTSFDTPNVSVEIARNLAANGTYVCNECGTRLYGPISPGEKPLRMFLLPGEPLYLAACFRYLPDSLLRYIQLPFTVLLVLAASYVAQKLAGTLISVLVGVLATLEPFFVLHGPVWDDTFLGAALVWAIFALLFAALDDARGSVAAWRRPLRVGLIVVLAGYASITRFSSALVLLAVGLTILVLRQLRPIRIEGLAAIAAVGLALTAWGCRNYSVFGQFAIGSSHDGISFWESVYPSAREALLTRGQTERLNDERMQDDFARTSSMGELDANRYFLRRAVGYVLAEPADVARTAVVKIGVGLLGLKMEEPLLSARNLVAGLSNSILLILAAFGAGTLQLSAGRPQRMLWRCVAGSSLLVFVALSAFGPVGLRYRVGLEPVLWILASCCLMRMAGRLLRRIPCRVQPPPGLR